jgi:hypothetical protein
VNICDKVAEDMANDDLTLSNPNDLYEVGVRHGASGRATLPLLGVPNSDK